MAAVELHTYEVSCDGRTPEGSKCTSQVILSCPEAELTTRLQRRYGWKVLDRNGFRTLLCAGHHAPQVSEGLKVSVPQEFPEGA